ncbi:hypothetical protein BCR42DRAFT_413232 [Absidia repens]|uniref:Uncharacterized protein n=1 Tax=Absidia repens TaxID=90262 RepID=A0A1X2IKU5_9FUNG|nr:hypothetical protein BCR42DRAFT_413232 [Absidia repens]
MIRSGRILFLLVTINLIGLMSQQVWGQQEFHQIDHDPYALDYDLATAATTTTTTTTDILLDDTEQLPDAEPLEQDMDEDNEEEADEDDEYDGDDTPMDSYFGPLGQGDSKDQEQGDELGEELLVEYDEDDDDDKDAFGNDSDNNHDGLMFEDDEEPLDFKNDEQVDLDQLLFDASQKDTNTNMGYDYQQQEDEEIEDTTDDAIDQLLSNADDALIVDPLDETTVDAEHPDHNVQEQQQQQQPPNDDLLLPSSNNNNKNIGGSPLAIENQSYHHSSSQYKLPLFGVLALLILLYKVSNKKQGGRTKCLEKEEKGLPLHTKDLKTSDSTLDCSILVDSSASPLGTTTTQPSTTGSHHLGRRASSSSFFTPRQASNGGGGSGGHTRKISLGHHPMVGSHAIKESKWEDKYRQ